MPYEFKLPDLGEGLTEGEVARWLVAEGDEVAEDQPLVEIQTDKTTVEIPSPAAGRVTSIRVDEGDVVPVGTVLVVIGGTTPEPAVAASDMARGQTPDVSPSDMARGQTPTCLNGTRPLRPCPGACRRPRSCVAWRSSSACRSSR